MLIFIIKKTIMNRISKLAGLLAGTLLSLAGYQGLACSCRPLTVKEAYDNARVVVIGKVLSVRYLTGPDVVVSKPVDQMTIQEKYQNGITEKIVTVQVKSRIKGKEQGRIIEVTTGLGGGDCGVHFEENKDYIIYAYAKEGGNGRYATGICSTTKPYTKAECKTLKKIKKGKA